MSINKQQNADSFARKYGNVITIGLWIVALSSHAILLPKFFHDISEKKHAA